MRKNQTWVIIGQFVVIALLVLYGYSMNHYAKESKREAEGLRELLNETRIEAEKFRYQSYTYQTKYDSLLKIRE